MDDKNLSSVDWDDPNKKDNLLNSNPNVSQSTIKPTIPNTVNQEPVVSSYPDANTFTVKDNTDNKSSKAPIIILLIIVIGLTAALIYTQNSKRESDSKNNIALAETQIKMNSMEQELNDLKNRTISTESAKNVADFIRESSDISKACTVKSLAKILYEDGVTKITESDVKSIINHLDDGTGVCAKSFAIAIPKENGATVIGATKGAPVNNEMGLRTDILTTAINDSLSEYKEEAEQKSDNILDTIAGQFE